jgi:class 3 adenylate cyclase
MAGGRISVFLADDSVIVREGVRAMLGLEPDLEIVGTASDYDELVEGATEVAPRVLVTGIGLCTGTVAAALLGSEERLEYTLVGDTVNLAQRLQDLARPAGRIVMSESTHQALRGPVEAERLDPLAVKGRETPVQAYRITMIETTEEGTDE